MAELTLVGLRVVQEVAARGSFTAVSEAGDAPTCAAKVAALQGALGVVDGDIVAQGYAALLADRAGADRTRRPGVHRGGEVAVRLSSRVPLPAPEWHDRGAGTEVRAGTGPAQRRPRA